MQDHEPNSANDPVSLSDSRFLSIDKLCDQFDGAWRSGQKPSIEECLAQGEELDRTQLFKSLLEIEFEYRSRAGEWIDVSEYANRFPEFADVIKQMVADVDQRRGDVAPTDALPLVGEAVGSFLGRYKLLQPLGEGGFGVVYMAEQEKPVRRRVALKIIKLGMDTKQVIARFEAERQALALMDHPHIAKVLDAGATHSGRPYFVMELVKGISITKYCDDNNMALDDRLRLFIDACGAVQHAHQKGIIHRDIKPSNILVTHLDGKPVPKVIDFGIAKATDHRLTEQTVFTQLGQFIGTPAYMSPEQTQAQALDIDTRSDIYSLGVLLYELLTGTTPFQLPTSSSGTPALDEIKRIIREEEPSKPSTKLSTMGKAATTVAKRRGLAPTQLSGALSGDLDWIVMRALEKDRGRRYETASAFADDIRRYLAYEPVLARPPSRRYRIGKYVRRNKSLVASLTAISTLLLVAVLGTTFGMLEADRQRRLAVQAAEDEKTAKLLAEKRASQLQKSAELMANLFNDLDVKENAARKEPLEQTLAKRLMEVSHQLAGDAVADTAAAARLQNELGMSLLSLGHYDEAIGLFQKALPILEEHLGADHNDVLGIRNNLANGYRHAGNIQKALEIQTDVERTRRINLGDEHPQTIGSINDLAAVYRDAGEMDKALELAEEAVTLMKQVYGAEHQKTLVAMNNLADFCFHTGQSEKAIATMGEVVSLMRKELGEHNSDTINSIGNLGTYYFASGRLDDAARYSDEAMALAELHLGTEHPLTLIFTMQSANIQRRLGKVPAAIDQLQATLSKMQAKLGDDHKTTMACQGYLALALMTDGQYEKARQINEDMYRNCRIQFGDDHPQTLAYMSRIADSCLEMGDLNEALELYKSMVARARARLGAANPWTIIGIGHLARAYQASGQLESALPLIEEAVQLKSKQLPSTYRDTASMMKDHASMLLEYRDPEAALEVTEKLLQLINDVTPTDAKRRAVAQLLRAEALLALGNVEQASNDIDSALASELLSAPRRVVASSLRGEVLASRQEWDAAGPILIDAYEEMHRNLPNLKVYSRWVVSRACERVIGMYESWGKPEKALEWQQELERVKAEIEELRSSHSAAIVSSDGTPD